MPSYQILELLIFDFLFLSDYILSFDIYWHISEIEVRLLSILRSKSFTDDVLSEPLKSEVKNSESFSMARTIRAIISIFMFSFIFLRNFSRFSWASISMCLKKRNMLGLRCAKLRACQALVRSLLVFIDQYSLDLPIWLFSVFILLLLESLLW